MRASILQGYRPPAEVEIGDLAAPVPGAGQVLIRVRAASVNPLDVKLAAGAGRPFVRLRFPVVLGFDFAGEIEAVGAGVTGWKKGERVYGRTDLKTGGTHAELTAVGVHVVDRMPATLSFEEAASLPLAAITAVQALEQVQLKAGERVLVNGAAGGVGSAAIQIGRALGAEVAGVCSGEGAQVASRFGCRVIDYTKGELVREPERFDVVLDTVFNEPSEDLLRVLGDRRRYVTTGFSAALAFRAFAARFGSRRRFGFVMSRADGRLMRRVSELVTAGSLVPVIDSTFPLDRIADAYRRVECGHVHGKVVVSGF